MRVARCSRVPVLPAMVLSADPDAPYERTFVSKQYLAGAKGAGRCGVADTGGIAQRLHRECDRYRGEARRADHDGERIDYDVLVLATGAEPTPVDFDGSDRADVFDLRTLADADLLITAADKADKAIVLGSSLYRPGGSPPR